MARNCTVIGPMRAIPAQSKLSARRDESVASRGGSTRRLSRSYRKGSTKIRMPCARRRETVEHPFGTMKMRMGATHFLMKTLPKVATEEAFRNLGREHRTGIVQLGSPALTERADRL